MASTDGVGTKIQVAIAAGRPRHRRLRPRGPLRERHPGPGRRAPLLPRLHRARHAWTRTGWRQIVAGFARACAEFGCPLIGGETAEMPGTYAPDDYDLAGFIVGVVEQREGAAGAACAEGDVLLGLPSAGLHTNGYSWRARCSSTALGHRVDTALPELGTTRGRRRCSRRTAATSPRSSRCSSAARSARSPTSRAAASPATSRASCPTGLGARVRRGVLGGAAALPADPAGRAGRRRRDVPHLQHGHRHGGGGGARRTSTRSSTRSSGAARRASSSARVVRGRGRRPRVSGDRGRAARSACSSAAGARNLQALHRRRSARASWAARSRS